MKVDRADVFTPATQAVSAEKMQQAGAEAAAAEEESQKAEKSREDVIDFSSIFKQEEQTQLEKWREMLRQLEESKNAFKIKASPPKVNLQHLAARLVSSVTQMDVRTVMGEVGRAITQLQIALPGLEGKERQQAQNVLNSAKKLMGRCGRKIDDLDNEDVTRGRQKKAVRENQQKKAEQIKEELREMISARKARERRYLQERYPTIQNSDVPPGRAHGTTLDAATEAKIEALAEAIAAAESPVAGTGGGVEAAGGGEVSAGGGGSGGETAVAAGGGAASNDVAVQTE